MSDEGPRRTARTGDGRLTGRWERSSVDEGLRAVAQRLLDEDRRTGDPDAGEHVGLADLAARRALAQTVTVPSEDGGQQVGAEWRAGAPAPRRDRAPRARRPRR